MSEVMSVGFNRGKAKCVNKASSIHLCSLVGHSDNPQRPSLGMLDLETISNSERRRKHEGASRIAHNDLFRGIEAVAGW